MPGHVAAIMSAMTTNQAAVNNNDHHPHPVRWRYYQVILMTTVFIGVATTVSTHFQLSSAYGNGNTTMMMDVESSSSTKLSASNHNADNAAKETVQNSITLRGVDDDVSTNDDNNSYWTPSSTHEKSTASSSTNDIIILDQSQVTTSNNSNGSTDHGDSAASGSEGMHICTCLTNRHPVTSNLSFAPPPKRLRWLHIPKTGTSFISTLWAYVTTTEHRYIDLAVNSDWCSKGTTASYSMYDFALMRRYPWEMYGAPNMIPSSASSSSAPGTTIPDENLPLGLVGGTQHQPLAQNLNDKKFTSSPRYQKAKQQYKKFGSEVFELNYTVATFFRQPEDRIISAFYDARHASGFKTELFKQLTAASRLPASTKKSKHACKVGNRTYHNPLECYARFPGIAGCMSRMLTGENCADGLFQESGLENLPEAIDLILNHLEFVGLMEEWNESVCQFHRLYTGKLVDVQEEHHGSAASGSSREVRRRHWIAPLQGEFSNVHKSTKQHDYGLQDLHGFMDVADTVVYEAAKLKFRQMVGEERCYRYMTWDEIADARRQRKDGDDDDDFLPHVKMEADGKVCRPKSCSDLGKQCGEWDDGCGKTIICGMCNIDRTDLPSTWRVKCVEGRCIDYCPPWNEKGYWFLSDDSPSVIKQFASELGNQDRTYLSPVHAISICELACNTTKGKSSKSRKKWLKSLVSSGLCQCGSSPKMLKANLTSEDFSKAHDLNEMCSMNKARNSATLTVNETQPVCCPNIGEKPNPPDGWKRLFVLGSVNLEGEYFDHIQIECGGFQECESVARKKKAELAVFDLFNSMCYLARNVFDLKSMYTVTKDNHYRYSLDLRLMANRE